MDVLYYLSPRYGQLIVDSVTEQLNQKYRIFMEEHPGTYDSNILSANYVYLTKLFIRMGWKGVNFCPFAWNSDHVRHSDA